MSRRITERKRRKRKRKRRGNKSQALVLASRQHYKLRLRPGELELARGHDGLLRGYPEPVFLVAVYDVRAAKRCQLLARAAFRYDKVTELPGLVQPRDGGGVAGLRVAGEVAVVVLAIAVEQDSSRDIQKLYVQLEQPDAIVAWPTTGVPETIEQLAESLPREDPTAVEIKLGGRYPSEWFRSDDFISAAAACATISRHRPRDFDFPARSADGRNDWRARVSLRLG